MKKRIMTAAALVAMFFGLTAMPAKAQVFLDDEEMSKSLRSTSEESDLPTIPQLNVTYDQYAPMGEGIVVLGLLGGAYLLGKKRKDEK